MTSKDYIRIAKAVEAAHKAQPLSSASLSLLVDCLSAELKLDNPAFNEDKFVSYIMEGVK